MKKADKANQTFAAAAAPLSDEEPAGEEDGVIRCICGNSEDDGYTIQCEKCHVWQHVACLKFENNEVPDQFLCERCSPRAQGGDKGKQNAKRAGGKSFLKEREKERDRDARDAKSKKREPPHPSPKKHRKDVVTDAKSEKEIKDLKHKVTKVKGKDQKTNGKEPQFRDRDEQQLSLKQQNASPISPPRKRQRETSSISALKTKPSSTLDRHQRIDSRLTFEKSLAASPFPSSQYPFQSQSVWRSPEFVKVPRRSSYKKYEPISPPKLSDAFETDYYVHAHGYSISDCNIFADAAFEAHVDRVCSTWDATHSADNIEERHLQPNGTKSQATPTTTESAFAHDELYSITARDFRDQIFSSRAVMEDIVQTDDDGDRNLRYTGLFVASDVKADSIVGEILGRITSPLGLQRRSIQSNLWDVEPELLEKYYKPTIFDSETEGTPILSSVGFPARKVLLPPVDCDCRDRTRILLPPFVFPHPSRALMHNGWPLLVDAREESSLDSARPDEQFGEHAVLNCRLRLCVVATKPIRAGEEVILECNLDDWRGYPCACSDDLCPVASTVALYEGKGSLNISRLIPPDLSEKKEIIPPSIPLSALADGPFSYILKPDVVSKPEAANRKSEPGFETDILRTVNGYTSKNEHHGGKKAWLKSGDPSLIGLKRKRESEEEAAYSSEIRNLEKTVDESEMDDLNRKGTVPSPISKDDLRKSPALPTEATVPDSSHIAVPQESQDDTIMAEVVRNESQDIYVSSSNGLATSEQEKDTPAPHPNASAATVRKVTLKDFVKRGIPKANVAILTSVLDSPIDRTEGLDSSESISPTKEKDATLTVSASSESLPGLSSLQAEGSLKAEMREISMTATTVHTSSEPSSADVISKPGAIKQVAPDSMDIVENPIAAVSIPNEASSKGEGYFSVKSDIENLFNIKKPALSPVKSPVRSPVPENPPLGVMGSAAGDQQSRRASIVSTSGIKIGGETSDIPAVDLAFKETYGRELDRQSLGVKSPPGGAGIPAAPFGGALERERERAFDWDLRRPERDRDRDRDRILRDREPSFPAGSRAGMYNPPFDRSRGVSGQLPEFERDRLEADRDRDWLFERERERERERLYLERERSERPDRDRFPPDERDRTALPIDLERDLRRPFQSSLLVPEGDERNRMPEPERFNRMPEAPLSAELERGMGREPAGPREREGWESRDLMRNPDRERERQLPLEREARDIRDPRDLRDPRDSREPRDPREARGDTRDLRDPRDARETRDLRDPRPRDRAASFRDRDRERERDRERDRDRDRDRPLERPFDHREKDRPVREDPREFDRERAREKERFEKDRPRERERDLPRKDREPISLRDRERERERERDSITSRDRLRDREKPERRGTGWDDLSRLRDFGVSRTSLDGGASPSSRRPSSPRLLGSKPPSPILLSGRQRSRSPSVILSADASGGASGLPMESTTPPGKPDEMLPTLEMPEKTKASSEVPTNLPEASGRNSPGVTKLETVAAAANPGPDGQATAKKEDEEEGEVAEGDTSFDTRGQGRSERIDSLLGRASRVNSAPNPSHDRRGPMRNLSPPSRPVERGGKLDYDDRYRWERSRDPYIPASRGPVGASDRHAGRTLSGSFRDRDRERERDRERDRDRDRERPLERPFDHRDKDRPVRGADDPRELDRERERAAREKERAEKDRLRDRERELPRKEREPLPPRERERDRDRERDRRERERERERRDRDRDRERDRDRRVSVPSVGAPRGAGDRKDEGFGDGAGNPGWSSFKGSRSGSPVSAGGGRLPGNPLDDEQPDPPAAQGAAMKADQMSEPDAFASTS
ncbi:hypothetical protein HDU96_007691 [Phlyctochytrium bullatum]|nr:hypothetical protein HDU96_007691 [Phlyctochytrium bullatum]